ncbi:putative UDP-galactose 4-epimerase [Xylariomycetidae sp. FL2044]|nr:putative UDP-galactose 4-epimerase [Xylariomycetidae sp. FL2044]
MKIAITGARGTLGRDVVKVCSEAGHATVQINRSEQAHDGTPNSEMRIADVATDYEATKKAFADCDAVIHLAAIPDPLGKDDTQVFGNNVMSAFNGFRAAAESGIERVSYASSVNAIGLAFCRQPRHFPYFPIDEDYPPDPTDPYALGKLEGEVAARSFVRWFPGLKIACLRIHEVAPREAVKKEHREKWEETGVKQLWGWVNPTATARACLLGATADTSEWESPCEVFNIHAPEIAEDGSDGTTSEELARKYFPDTAIRGDLSGTKAFWTIDKAERLLGWEHPERE